MLLLRVREEQTDLPVTEHPAEVQLIGRKRIEPSNPAGGGPASPRRKLQSSFVDQERRFTVLSSDGRMHQLETDGLGGIKTGKRNLLRPVKDHPPSRLAAELERFGSHLGRGIHEACCLIRQLSLGSVVAREMEDPASEDGETATRHVHMRFCHRSTGVIVFALR